LSQAGARRTVGGSRPDNQALRSGERLLRVRHVTRRARVRGLGAGLVVAALAVVALVAAVVAAPPPAAADQVRDGSWQLAALKVAAAHRIVQGEGVTVAVIDTGVDANHPDLRGNVLAGFDAWNTVSGDKGQRDVVGHGTGVASLIAGHGHGAGNRDGVLGIAPRARILPINVKNPRSPLISPDTVGDAIQVAADRGAQVICVALAGSWSSRQQDAVEYATGRGALVIAAAGNRSEISLMGNPASIKAAVAVSSLDRGGEFSATSVTGPEMDLAAPGVNIPVATPGGGYQTATGTSAAAAIVAGAAALVRARYPGEHRNMFLQRLVWTATDRGEKGRDAEYGWGALNLLAALTTTPRQPDSGGSPPQAAADTPSDAHQPRVEILGVVLALLGWLAALTALTALVIGLIVVLRRRGRRRPEPAEPARSAPPAPRTEVDHEAWTRPPSGSPPGGG
jgi:type VII secretion-associated serine protease mycosin